jgi:protein dithiol:quinone oxidoreductase
MKLLSELTTSSRPWQILAISALIFELIALYFQYVMGLAPCIMCIYQRVAVWAIFLAGIIGSVGYRYLLTRLMAYLLWGTGAIWGLLLAKEHVEMQSAAFSLFFSCEIVPNFPNWAPLHQWLPALFEASGDCGAINWQFLQHSMPEWMMVIFASYSVVLVLVLLGRLTHSKMF